MNGLPKYLGYFAVIRFFHWLTRFWNWMYSEPTQPQSRPKITKNGCSTLMPRLRLPW